MDSVTPQMIDSIKAFVGYQKVRLEGKKIIKEDPRILLNCSSIAKGYACDVIARPAGKGRRKELHGRNRWWGHHERRKSTRWLLRVGINKPEIGTSGVTNDVEENRTIMPKRGCGYFWTTTETSTSRMVRNMPIRSIRRTVIPLDKIFLARPSWRKIVWQQTLTLRLSWFWESRKRSYWHNPSPK